MPLEVLDSFDTLFLFVRLELEIVTRIVDAGLGLGVTQTPKVGAPLMVCGLVGLSGLFGPPEMLELPVAKFWCREVPAAPEAGALDNPCDSPSA